MRIPPNEVKKERRQSLENTLDDVSLVILFHAAMMKKKSSNTYHDEKSNGGDELVAFKWRILEVILAKDTLRGTKTCTGLLVNNSIHGSTSWMHTPSSHRYSRDGSQTCPGRSSTVTRWDRALRVFVNVCRYSLLFRR